MIKCNVKEVEFTASLARCFGFVSNAFTVLVHSRRSHRCPFQQAL